NQFAVYHFFNLPTIAIRPPTWATSAFNVVCRHLCHLSARPLAIAVEHTVISANLLRRHIGRVTLFVRQVVTVSACPLHCAIGKWRQGRLRMRRRNAMQESPMRRMAFTGTEARRQAQPDSTFGLAGRKRWIEYPEQRRGGQQEQQ